MRDRNLPDPDDALAAVHASISRVATLPDERLDGLLARLSPATLHARFHSAGLRVDAGALVCGPDTRTYLAEVGSRPAGLACYARIGSTRAETAIVVADGDQRRGLGGRLLQRVVRDARDEGLREIVAVVERDNAGALALLEGAGVPTARSADGSAFVVTLAIAAPDGRGCER